MRRLACGEELTGALCNVLQEINLSIEFSFEIIFIQLEKNFPNFCGTHNFITVLVIRPYI